MSDRRDPYRGFASHYDLHGWDWYAHIYGPKILVLLKEMGFEASRVLDAGCGTGTLALRLAKRGHQVTGIDLSEEMLAVARGKDRTGRVVWKQADITRFDLTGSEAPFDVVVCVADTINHLESAAEWDSALSCFAVHLRPGGLLFLDAMTAKGLERLDKFGVAEVDGRTLLISIIYEPPTRRSTVKVTSFIPSSSPGLYTRATGTISEWAHPVDEIFDRVRKAGFEGTNRLWPMAEDPEMDDRLILIGRRG